MNRFYDAGFKGIRVGGLLPEEVLDDDLAKVLGAGKAHIVVEGATLEDAVLDGHRPIHILGLDQPQEAFDGPGIGAVLEEDVPVPPAGPPGADPGSYPEPAT